MSPRNGAMFIFLIDKVVGSKDVFDIPKDEYVKWYMYSWYRQLLQGEENFGEICSRMQSASEEILGKPVKLTFDQHVSGWNISVKSPFTMKLLIIKEDGKFMMK